MDRIIVVLGDVADEQHQDARLSVLNRGHRPQIVNLAANELLLTEQQLIERYATDEQKCRLHHLQQSPTAADALQVDKIFRDLAEQHVNASGPLNVIVMDDATYDGWTSHSYVVQAISELGETEHWAVLSGEAQYVG